MVIKYSKLPDTLYTVYVPAISTYSDMEMEVMGLPMREPAGGRAVSAAEDMVRVMLPITRIIDIYRTGAPIRLANPTEVSEMYTVLEKYLHETNSVTPEFNVASYTENRDVDIDRFASEMFDLNRDDIVNTTVNKKSGFDIGIHKMNIPNPGTSRLIKSRGNVADAYGEENPTVNGSLDDIYITHNSTNVDPATVKRKPRVRKRQKIKFKES